MSKRITALALAFMLVLSLFGCGKIRTPDNYYVGEYGDGWSILYKNENGEAEEIVPLGDYAQPLVLIKGRLYFIDGDALVSADTDGEDRKRLPMKGIDGGYIAYIDESSLYCIKDSASLTCYKADLELAGCEEIPIPRAFRQTSYPDLLKAMKEKVAAVENQIRVRSAYITLDGNGSLASMELDVLTFRGWTGSMKVWSSGTVSVQITTDDPVIRYTDLNVPLSLADSTTERTITLDTLMTAAETADKSELAPKRGSSSMAEGYVLAYLHDDYESLISNAPWLGVSGVEAAADSSVSHFVLAQYGGGMDAVLTDSLGRKVGNPAVLRFDC